MRRLGRGIHLAVDDAAPGVKERGGIPVLGTLDQATQVAAAHHADQLYVALPLEEHAKLLRLIKNVSNECVDIKVVPDLVQYATVKAVLEDLDGIPIISLSEVPLRGWNRRRAPRNPRMAVVGTVTATIAQRSATVMLPP